MTDAGQGSQGILLKKTVSVFFFLVVAGLAGNYFGYELFFSIQFIFGSIFSFLALQFLGLRWGVFAGAIISSVTWVLWNNPYAIIILTVEVLSVGILTDRRRLDLVVADALYWICVGMPLSLLFFFGIMHMPFYSFGVITMKLVVNGIANALLARFIFIILRSSIKKDSFGLQDIFFNLLALSVLATSLLFLASLSRKDVADIDIAIRGSLAMARQRVTINLEKWLNSHEAMIVYLAEMARESSIREMQRHIEFARKYDDDFLRIGLLDKNSTVAAISPLVDELGKPNIGKNFADRPFIPVIKETLKPMLTDIEPARIGKPGPRAAVVAPVVFKGRFLGYMIGVLNLDRLREMIELNYQGQLIQGLQFTLTDRAGKVIVTNKHGLKPMDTFVQQKGETVMLKDGISQWLPPSKMNITISDRWKNSFYVVENPIGGDSEWRLIMELPIAPVQKMLYEKYASYLSEVFLLLLIALAVAKIVSRRIALSLENLSKISSDMPSMLTSVDKISWPSSTVRETSLLTGNLKEMSYMLAGQFRNIQEMNAGLEQRISDRTRDLAESEERFRSLFEKVPVVALVIDPADGAIVDANAAAAAFYGWTLEELHTKKISEINALTPEEIEKETEAARSEKRSYFLFRHRRADDEVRDVEVYSEPIQINGRTVLYSIVHDVTARRMAEHQIEQLANELQLILNTIAVGVAYVKERKLIWTNPAFRRIFGYTPEEMQVFESRRLYAHQEDYERAGRDAYPLINTGRVYTTEILSMRKDGSPFWLSLTGRAVNPGNLAEGSIWMLEDITERKAAEDALMASEERLRLALMAARQGLYDLNLQTGMATVNPEYAIMLGYDPEEFHETNIAWIERLHPDDQTRVVEAYQAYVCGELPEYRIEFRQRTKSGDWKWILSLGKIIERDASGNPLRMVGIHADITESKKAEEALREKTMQLEDLTKNLEDRVQMEVALRYKSEQTLIQQSKLAAMGEMLGAIAHQWRQPLNALGLIIQNVKDAQAYGELDKSYLERSVEKAMAQIKHMSKTIDDFRNFFVKEKEQTSFDSMQAVGDVLSLFSAQLVSSNIDFRLTCHTHGKSFTRVEDITPCQEKSIRGFRNEFEHVMMNLINNAREAIVERREKGRMDRNEQGLIVFDFRQAGGMALIDVRDNGGGIPEAIINRIFEPYFSTKGPSKGTGLGLYMSKVIVEDNMQGKLFATNSTEGAVFSIELPLA